MITIQAIYHSPPWSLIIKIDAIPELPTICRPDIV